MTLTHNHPDTSNNPDQQAGPQTRQLPHDLQAEESLLGATILNNATLDTTQTLVDPDSFYKPAHGTIWAAIGLLHHHNRPIDVATLSDQLRRDSHLDDIGGSHELLRLQSACPVSTNAETYARIVADYADMRHLIRVGHDLTELAQGLPGDLGQAYATARQLLDTDPNDQQPRPLQLEDNLDGWLDRLEQLCEQGGDPAAIPTGLTLLDKRLAGGLRPGQLTVIAARPSKGKSALGVVITLNAAKTGRHVLFASLEMTTDEITARMVSVSSRIGLQTLRNGELRPAQWDEVGRVTARLAGYPIDIYEHASLSVAGLDQAVRQLTPDLVIVDYLQLMAPDGARRAGTREEDVAGIARALKRVALGRHVPVIALAQLNRDIEHRANKRPGLADLRESGAIEQDADNVIALHHEEERPMQVELITLKQRNGPIGSDWFEWHPDFTRIQDRSHL